MHFGLAHCIQIMLNVFMYIGPKPVSGDRNKLQPVKEIMRIQFEADATKTVCVCLLHVQ